MYQDRSELNVAKIEEIIDQWRKEFENVKPEDVAYYVILYSGNKEDNAIVYKTAITSNIGKEFVHTLKEDIKSLNTDKVSEYDKTDGLPKGFFEISYTSEIPNYKKLKDATDTTKIFLNLNIDKINNKTLKLIVKIGRFYGFGNISQHKIMLNHHNKIHVKLNTEGKFDIMEDTIYFDIPKTFSAISLGDHIIIKNENQFENIFKYHEKIIQIIVEKQKENENLFNDREFFEKSITQDSRKARKLYPVYKGNYLKNVNVDDIMKYANKFTSDIVVDKETGKISVEKSNIWHLISVLCEDYYDGTLSNRKLRAGQKSDVSSQN